MAATKKPKLTKAQLRRKLMEVEAQLSFRCNKEAQAKLDKMSTNNLMGCGALMQISTLGGAVLLPPVLIRDGLSQATINAIKADLQRSHDLSLI